MKLSPETWHKRYLEQARWTQAARLFLFNKIDLAHKKNILEVGCGTGAILEEFSAEAGYTLVGLDLAIENLAFARGHNPGALLAQGNAHDLPFCSGIFEVVYTHFLLLWLNDPVKAIKEMRRVVTSGGYVLALAEPDYGGRIDYPSELSVLGNWQAASLKLQGADPLTGRKLGEYFLKAGLVDIQSGVLGGEWHHPPTSLAGQTEWEILINDLESLSDGPPKAEVQRLMDIETQARNFGSRVLYVPTFYVLGKVPG
jgi:SAM-dependent methyltransferase